MKGKIKITPAHESECTVIGALILDCTLFPMVKEHLCEQDFYYAKHKRIYHVMGELWATHKKFDAPMIVDQIDYLKDNVLEEEVYGLANECPSLKNIRAHMNIIREKSVQRQLIQVATEIAEEAANPNTSNIKDMLDKAESMVMSVGDAYESNTCPFQQRLASFLREFAEEVATVDLTEKYLRESIVEVNKAFIATLAHVEEHPHSENE